MTSQDIRSTSDASSDEIDLRQLLGVLVDHKWLIAGITSVFFALSVAYAVLSTPVYEADAMVQVESKIPGLPALSDLSESLGMGGTSESSTEIALITSRTVIGEAADQSKMDISIQPYRFPIIGEFISRRASFNDPDEVIPPVLGMNSYGWGGEDLEIFQFEVPVNLMAKDLMLQVDASPESYKLYDDDNNLLLQGKVGSLASANGVKLQVSNLKANPGTRFHVSKLRRLDVISDLQQKVIAAEVGKDSGILALSYQNPNAQIAQEYLQRVAQAYVRQNVERNSAEASAQLAFVKDQLPNVRRQVDSAQAALSQYQTRANSVDLTLQTKGLLDQAVAVETSIQQLRLQQADMDRKFTRDHPAYQALMRQIAELESRKAGFQGEVKELPEAQQELLKLSRDVQVSNDMYTALLGQAQQLDVARAGTVGNVRIVDAASVDDQLPVKPRKKLIVLIGIIFGLGTAIAVVLIRQMLNRGIEDPAEIEEIGLPVYASIPVSVAQSNDSVRNIRADGKVHLLAINEPADLAVEAIRSLRTSLHFARLEAKNNIVLISGSSPNAGKTFVSSNLGAVIAQAGQRVLMIDADMRKGTLHKALGASQKPGLSDLLVGRATINEVTKVMPGLDTLHFISRGESPPNPSELLMHQNFTNLLHEVSAMYDLVIVDTPPILAVTDAAVIAHHAGTCLLVARFGLNQQKELALARKRFEQNNVKIKGAVFNAVERRAAGYYSYGYYEYKSTKS